MKCGATKEQLDGTIGIHPTCAEVRALQLPSNSVSFKFQTKNVAFIDRQEGVWRGNVIEPVSQAKMPK